MTGISGLSVFITADCAAKYAGNALRSTIKKVVCCALGPKGNNIEQAAMRWLERMSIADKSEMALRDTPELCLSLARDIKEDGVVAIFWTCAVYSRENEFFFGNPDVFPFFFQEEMPLDEMQLATRPDLVAHVNDKVPSGWKTASHPSPAPLIRGLSKIVLQNSNAAAARACANCETELCITTESARQIYGLAKLHSFGSPNMVFFGGITQHGLAQIKKVLVDMGEVFS